MKKSSRSRQGNQGTKITFPFDGLGILILAILVVSVLLRNPISMLLDGQLSLEFAKVKTIFPIEKTVKQPVAVEDEQSIKSWSMDDFQLEYINGVLHSGKWNEEFFQEPFRIEEKVYKAGFAAYIPSSETDNGKEEMIIRMIANRSGEVAFIYGCESWWCYGSNYGEYKLLVKINDQKVLETEWLDYQAIGEYQLTLLEEDLVTITIREKSGTDGTLNVIHAFKESIQTDE